MNPSNRPQPADTGMGHNNSFNVSNSYNTNYNTTCLDENAQILEWLSPLEPRLRHQDVRTRRLDGLGDWFLRMDNFVNWRNGEDGSGMVALFCTGAPGAGKTYLNSLVIDELCDSVVDQEVAVACFYCDFQSQKMQTPENVLDALTKQIARGLESIPTEISAAFQKAKSQVGGRGLRAPETLELLKATLSPLKRAFICIDALDEFQGKHLPKLLRSLHAISQSCPGVRFFFTGRPHMKVEIEKYFAGRIWLLQMKPTTQDILRYVKMMLDDDPNPEEMSLDLRMEIMYRVSETISDVFLLVALNIAAILDETTIYQRREQLKRMTNGRGLGDAYGVTLDRIKAQSGGKSRLALGALMWISKSERPMSPNELCYALSVQIGSTDSNPDNIPSMQTVLTSCLGLVTVDREETIVRLVHFTLQEYLDSWTGMPQNPYAAMAEVCLTFLNFDCVRELSPALDDAPRKYPFLEHASCCWGYYAGSETTEGVKSLALQLLDGFDSHISAKIVLHQHVDELERWSVRLDKGFTGLHCVAILGIDEIAEALLDTKDWDVDKPDPMGRTPLIWASMNGCEGVMRLLLEKAGAGVNTKDTRRGQTPLSWAIEYEQEEAAELLLEQDEVNPESRNNYGRTPLSHAAQRGSEWIAELLLEREEVDPESRDDSGKTPLSYAAESGSKEIVKMLLEGGEPDLELRDNYGRTPLSLAVESRSVEVVKQLLKLGEVNPESRDDDGRTPLSWAAGFGTAEIIELLLEREEVNPESRDDFGRTPLSWAAEDGTEEAVCVLLEMGEVDPESWDNAGRTPLSYAASNGENEDIAVLLVELGGADPESPDNSGRTPLSWAAEYGNVGAARLLVEYCWVNSESRDNGGRTPLSYAAAEWWTEEIVKLLLEQEEVNPESRDNSGRTPLSYAAGGGSELGTLKLLLRRDEVSLESRDNCGRTPLAWAAQCGHEEMAKLLLEGEEVNPESRDNLGRTPLSYAAEVGSVGILKLLLERGEVNPESRDNCGRTPLFLAAQYGNEEAAELLLERGEVNPGSCDNDGRPPLSYAARWDRVGVLKLLLEQDGVNPESRDNHGRTPLSHAVRSGSEGALKLLLEREDVNLGSQDNFSRTPLSYAAEGGSVEILRLLLEREEIDPESRDHYGRTLLSWAARSGNEGTAKLLLERGGANLESRDNFGGTPLSWAALFGEVGIVKLLREHLEASPKS